MGFPKQEYWSGLPFPPSEDLPHPGTEPASLRSPALARGFLALVPPGVEYSVQFSCSVVSDFVTPWTAACQASLSITNSQSLLKLMSIMSVIPSNHLILCFPLLPPSVFPSIRVFSNKSVLHIRWPKYWSFSFSKSPSNEHSGLISFRIDWLDLLAVQGTLKSLLQHHSSKSSILWCSAFFIIQFSHLYTTTGKTIALTRWTIFGNRAPLTASGPRFSPVSCHWSAPLHSPETTLAAVHLHVPNLTPFTGFTVMQVSACGDTLPP